MIKRYLRIPFDVEAIRWTGNIEDYTEEERKFFPSGYRIINDDCLFDENGYEHSMMYAPGDYVVRREDGDYFQLSKEQFDEMFVEDKIYVVSRKRCIDLIKQAISLISEKSICEACGKVIDTKDDQVIVESPKDDHIVCQECGQFLRYVLNNAECTEAVLMDDAV